MPDKLRLLDVFGRPLAADYGGGGALIPPVLTHAAVYNTASRTFLSRWDEALRHLRENAVAMRRDPFIRALWQERTYPTVNRKWQLVADNPKDPVQKATARTMTAILRETPHWGQFVANQMEAVWYGRYGSQIVPRQRQVQRMPRWCIARHMPVNGDKIQFCWDGTPAVLISGQARSLYPDDAILNTDMAPALKLNRPEWRRQFVIHRHELEDSDYWEGDLAGGINGLGLRGRVYWAWWLRDELLSWAVDYMKKVGTMGLLIFPFLSGNAQSQKQAEANAQAVSHQAALTMPVTGNPNDDASLAPIQVNASTNGIDSLRTMISDYFERHIERLFVGQSMSSGADNESGMGGTGRAQFAENTKWQLLKFDADNLSDSFTEDLVAPLQKLNFPGPEFDFRLRFKFMVEDPDAKDKAEAIDKAVAWGLPIDADEAYEVLGFTEPEEGRPTIGGKPQIPGMDGPGGGAPGGDDPNGPQPPHDGPTDHEGNPYTGEPGQEEDWHEYSGWDDPDLYGFDPSEARDQVGKWTNGGGSAGGTPAGKPRGSAAPADQAATLARVRRAANDADMNDPMGEGKGVNIRGRVPKHIGDQFDAHGTATLESLAKLLNGGVDPSREFYSSPLSQAGAGYGVSVRDDSAFVVLGHPGQTIKAGGIAGVLVDGQHAGSIPDLRKAFPGVKFISAKDAPELLAKVAAGFGKPVQYAADGWPDLYRFNPDQPRDESGEWVGGGVRKLLRAAARVPAALKAKVTGFVGRTHAKLEAKYGSAGAKLVLGGMLALLPTPLPGSSFIPVAIAEAITRLRRAFRGAKPAEQYAATEPMTADQIDAAARTALAELFRELGEELPDLNAAIDWPDLYAAEDWANRPGPRSNRRWVNVHTGKVVYSDSNPGGGAGRGKKAAQQPGENSGQKPPPAANSSQKQPGEAAQQPAPAKEARPQIEDTIAHVDALRKNFSTEGLLALARNLQHHTVAELREVKARLGLKASGAKAELAKKIAERALAAGDAKEKPVPKPVPAKPKTEAPKPAETPKAAELDDAGKARAKKLADGYRRAGRVKASEYNATMRDIAAAPKEVAAETLRQMGVKRYNGDPRDTLAEFYYEMRQDTKRTEMVDLTNTQAGRDQVQARQASLKDEPEISWADAKKGAKPAAAPKEKPKAEAPKPAAPPAKSATPTDAPAFADAVKDTIGTLGEGSKFGPNKVWIGDVYDAMKKKDPDLTREEFNKRLLAADRAGDVVLSRADMAPDMDQSKVKGSEINSGLQSLHFVTNDRGAAAWDKRSAPAKLSGEKPAPQEKAAPVPTAEPSTVPEKPTPAPKAAPELSPDAVRAAYDRAGTTAMVSELNAAMRSAAAMPKKDAAALLASMGFKGQFADPNRELVDMIHSRRGGRLRATITGDDKEAMDRVRAELGKLEDEPLLHPDKILPPKEQPKAAATAQQTPPREFTPKAKVKAPSRDELPPAGRAAHDLYHRATNATDAEIESAVAGLSKLPPDERVKAAASIGIKTTADKAAKEIRDAITHRRGSLQRAGMLEPAPRAAAPHPAAAKLKDALEKARTTAEMPEAEVKAVMDEIDKLKLPELRAAAAHAGVERAEKSSKADLINRIKTRLTAGKRFMDQTAH